MSARSQRRRRAKSKQKSAPPAVTLRRLATQKGRRRIVYQVARDLERLNQRDNQKARKGKAVRSTRSKNAETVVVLEDAGQKNRRRDRGVGGPCEKSRPDSRKAGLESARKRALGVAGGGARDFILWC